MSITQNLQTFWHQLTSRLNSAGQWIPPLLLRLILFWEFWESGITKYAAYQQGGDALKGTIAWFGGLDFPFPFDQLDASTNFYAAMWGEMFFAILILFGLFTRFAAVSLIVITAVAAAAAHWPESWSTLSELWQGYAISDKGFGNYKLALLFIIMLMPLLFSGPGKFSLDHLLTKLTGNDTSHPITSDFISKGLALIVIGLPLFFVMQTIGIVLIVAGIALIITDRLITPTG